MFQWAITPLVSWLVDTNTLPYCHWFMSLAMASLGIIHPRWPGVAVFPRIGGRIPAHPRPAALPPSPASHHQRPVHSKFTTISPLATDRTNSSQESAALTLSRSTLEVEVGHRSWAVSTKSGSSVHSQASLEGSGQGPGRPSTGCLVVDWQPSVCTREAATAPRVPVQCMMAAWRHVRIMH